MRGSRRRSTPRSGPAGGGCRPPGSAAPEVGTSRGQERSGGPRSGVEGARISEGGRCGVAGARERAHEFPKAGGAGLPGRGKGRRNLRRREVRLPAIDRGPPLRSGPLDVSTRGAAEPGASCAPGPRGKARRVLRARVVPFPGRLSAASSQAPGGLRRRSRRRPARTCEPAVDAGGARGDNRRRSSANPDTP